MEEIQAEKTNQPVSPQAPPVVKKKKSNLPTIVIPACRQAGWLIAILLIGAGGVCAGVQIGKRQMAGGSLKRPVPTPILQPTEIPVTLDETANWKTYRDEELGFEIKYPAEYEIDKGSKDGIVYLCKPLEYEGTCVRVLKERLNINDFKKKLKEGYHTDVAERTMIIGGQEAFVFLPVNALGMGNSDVDHIYVIQPNRGINLNLVLDYSDPTHLKILSTFKFTK